jgi:hypothetical protein
MADMLSKGRPRGVASQQFVQGGVRAHLTAQIEGIQDDEDRQRHRESEQCGVDAFSEPVQDGRRAHHGRSLSLRG